MGILHLVALQPDLDFQLRQGGDPRMVYLWGPFSDDSQLTITRSTIPTSGPWALEQQVSPFSAARWPHVKRSTLQSLRRPARYRRVGMIELSIRATAEGLALQA